MTTNTHILDLAREAEPPTDGILSRTVFQDDRLKAVVFGYGRGQELPEAQLLQLLRQRRASLAGTAPNRRRRSWRDEP